MTSGCVANSASADAYGWHVVVGEGGEAPGFAYTVGLTKSFGHPELLMAGLDGDTMVGLLGDLAVLIKDGQSFTAGKTLHGLVVDYPVIFSSLSPALVTQHGWSERSRYRRRSGAGGWRVGVIAD